MKARTPEQIVYGPTVGGAAALPPPVGVPSLDWVWDRAPRTDHPASLVWGFDNHPTRRVGYGEPTEYDHHAIAPEAVALAALRRCQP